MGCESGEVTNDNTEAPKKGHSYPPCFQLEFKANKSINRLRSQNVIVNFNGVTPPAKAIVTLEKSGISFLFCIILSYYYAKYKINRCQWSSLAFISSFIT